MGVREGCSLSPAIFNFNADETMRHFKDKLESGNKLLGRRIPVLRFAVDTVLSSEKKEDLENM